MLLDSIRSFFKPKKKDPESFYSMVQSTQWKSFIGKDEIKMIIEERKARGIKK